MVALGLTAMVILQLATFLVLAWASILLWRRTKHWPYIIFFVVFMLQLLNILSLNIYRNFALCKCTVEEVDEFDISFVPFQAGVSSCVMAVSLALALIAGIGIIRIYSKHNKQEKQ